MPRYSITVQAMIAKTYDITATDKEFAYAYAHERFNSEPDTNGTYGDEIIDCRLIEPETKPKPKRETKTEIYNRLREYIQDITENQEPLDLLERLKP